MTRNAEAIVQIVEDDAAVRHSLALLLGLHGHATREFDSAEAFLASAEPGAPGCLVLDVRMPGMSGLELQAALRERGIDLPIIVITAHGDVAAARTAFRAGAIDFLEKPIDDVALLAAIATALESDRQRRAGAEAAAAVEARMARLSAREREVMWMVGAGSQNREIAARLGLSPRTVEIYKARMLEKLQVRGLPELLRLLRDVPRE